MSPSERPDDPEDPDGTDGTGKPGEQAGSAPARRSRTVLVTFLGAVVRRMGDWMPIGGTVELMTQLGLDAPSVRTAVFRLKQRGWLASETRDGVRGYALTATAQHAIVAGDEIIWHLRQPADLADGWCIVNFSIPEKMRSRRHQLRSHLAALGFGNVGTAMWLAPARMEGAAREAIDELDLASYSAVFVGAYVAGQELSDLVHQGWDLAEIDGRYRDFLDEFTPVLDGLSGRAGRDGLEPGEAFTTYVDVIDHWRTLPFRDPGLPHELLADDWSAPDAGALFERLVAALEGPALEHAAGHWPPSSR